MLKKAVFSILSQFVLWHDQAAYVQAIRGNLYTGYAFAEKSIPITTPVTIKSVRSYEA
jgi:hypothetical protein